MLKYVHAETSTRKGKILEDQIQSYCTKQKKVICKGLSRRPIFLTRYIECTIERKDRNKRMQFFFPAIELLRIGTEYTLENIDGKNCFEILGVTKEDTFGIHIREEIIGKDKILFLISTFKV